MTKFVSFLLLLLTQTACTSVIWKKTVQKENIMQREEAESLYAFNVLPNSQLIFLGQTYWYVLREDTSVPLAKALTAKLSQHYQIVAPYSGRILEKLPVWLQNEQQFYSEFCLNYRAVLPSENETLKQLGFQAQRGQNEWRQCYAITGKIYAADKATQSEIRFAHHVPVMLRLMEYHVSIHSKKFFRNLILTPAALAIDVTAGAITIPVLLANDMRQLPKKILIDAPH